MSETKAATGTVRLHRVLKAPAERVYEAFLDPDAMAKWLPPHGFTGRVHASDVRVGGGYRMSFTNFGTGSSHSFGGTYREPMDGPRVLPGSRGPQAARCRVRARGVDAVARDAGLVGA